MLECVRVKSNIFPLLNVDIGTLLLFLSFSVFEMPLEAKHTQSKERETHDEEMRTMDRQRKTEERKIYHRMCVRTKLTKIRKRKEQRNIYRERNRLERKEIFI